MANRDDAAALRWLVGVELNRYRGRTTLALAAKAIGCSTGKIGHMEIGRNQQQPGEVRDLMRFYGANQADVDRLVALTKLAASAGEQAWWHPWKDVVPDWLTRFIGLEGLSTKVAVYAPQVLPALVQTEQYGFAATAGNIRVRPDHNDRVVGLRLERQRRIFADDSPLEFEAFIEEGVLDRPMGDRDVMRAQWQHLLEVAQLSHVSIRLLPTSLGRHDALVGRFTVLDFEAAKSVAYLEFLNDAVYEPNQDQVAGYTRIVEQLRKVALSTEATVREIDARLSAR